MRKIRVTVDLTTELSEEQIRGIYVNVKGPAITLNDVTVLTTWVDHATVYADLIAQQEQWIAEHGSDLAGYIQRYGAKTDPTHSGEGGEAIYQADLGTLDRLKQCLATEQLRLGLAQEMKASVEASVKAALADGGVLHDFGFRGGGNWGVKKITHAVPQHESWYTNERHTQEYAEELAQHFNVTHKLDADKYHFQAAELDENEVSNAPHLI